MELDGSGSVPLVQSRAEQMLCHGQITLINCAEAPSVLWGVWPWSGRKWSWKITLAHHCFILRSLVFAFVLNHTWYMDMKQTYCMVYCTFYSVADMWTCKYLSGIVLPNCLMTGLSIGKNNFYLNLVHVLSFKVYLHKSGHMLYCHVSHRYDDNTKFPPALTS